MKELIYVIKTVWMFLTKEPKERTDEEWNDILIVGEALKRTREMSERSRRRKNRSMYRTGMTYRKRRRK